MLFGAAVNSGPVAEWGPWLAVAGVLNSALSLGYYAWIMRKMYMEESPDMSRVKEPKAMVAVLVFAAVFMVGFGIWHAPLIDFASQAVPDLSFVSHAAPGPLSK
jgi:NADH-quinone oxidoreductase subunit N